MTSLPLPIPFSVTLLRKIHPEFVSIWARFLKVVSKLSALVSVEMTRSNERKIFLGSEDGVLGGSPESPVPDPFEGLPADPVEFLHPAAAPANDHAFQLPDDPNIPNGNDDGNVALVWVFCLI